MLSPETLEDAGSPATILMAVSTVGAGLLAIASFIYGLNVAQTAHLRGHVIAIIGLVVYFVVWAWAIYMARYPKPTSF